MSAFCGRKISTQNFKEIETIDRKSIRSQMKANEYDSVSASCIQSFL
jgi:hypothetical protein